MTTDQHTPPSAILRTVLVTVGLLLTGAVALARATDGFQAFTTETARRVAVRRHPVPVPAVPLENQSGERLTLADFKGQWVLVDFIYTNCTTFCMTLGGDFARLQRQLDGPISEGKLRLLSISFDPGHDAPAELAGYLARFRSRYPAWQAARPITTEGLAQLKRAFGLTVIPDNWGGFTHNAAILLVNPAGELVDILDIGQVEKVKAAVLGRLAS